ncbi:hypothetical protein LINGRAHAP2_LOCUS10497 [Linum grandiflorum]
MRLLSILNGKTLKPNTDATAKARDDWAAGNAQLVTWLLASVDSATTLSLRRFASAAEMWKHICDTHSQTNSARQFELENEIALFCQGDRDIGSYYQDFLTLWTEYDMLTASLIKEAPSDAVVKERDRSRLMQFLMKLRPEFESIRASLLHRNVASLDVVLGELIREEIRLRSQARLDGQSLSSIASESAFAVCRPGSNRPQFQRGNTSHLTCHFCHELGHIQPHCKKRNICSYCKQSGHIIHECKILAKRGSRTGSSSSTRGTVLTLNAPSGSSYAVASAPGMILNDGLSASSASSPILTSADVRRLIAEALQDVLPTALTSAFATGTSSGTISRWLLDSAAFNHMTHARDHFSTLKLGSVASFQVANGAHISACGLGKVNTGMLLYLILLCSSINSKPGFSWSAHGRWV